MLGKYFLFADRSALMNSFHGVIAGDAVSNCGDASSPTPWHQGSSTTNAGLVACGIFQNHAEVIWTNDPKNMLGVIRSSGNDVASVYKWWRDNG